MYISDHNNVMNTVSDHLTIKMSNMLSRGEKTQSAPNPVTCLLVGAGSRGHTYAAYALYYPSSFKVRFCFK